MNREEIQNALMTGLSNWQRVDLAQELKFAGETVDDITHVDDEGNCHTKNNIYVSIDCRGEEWVTRIPRNPDRQNTEDKSERVCPFCGCEDLEIDKEYDCSYNEIDGYHAYCLECDARGPVGADEERAIKSFTEVRRNEVT